jgi:hypothetical protein
MKLDANTIKRRWRTLLGWAGVIAGALVLVLGYVGVSGQTLVAKQLPYLISGGLGGLVLVGGGVGVLLAEDLRAERARIGTLESELLEVRDLLRTLVEQREGSSRAS